MHVSTCTPPSSSSTTNSSSSSSSSCYTNNLYQYPLNASFRLFPAPLQGKQLATTNHNSFANDILYLSSTHPRGLIPHPPLTAVTAFPVLTGSSSGAMNASAHNRPSQPQAAQGSGNRPAAAAAAADGDDDRVRSPRSAIHRQSNTREGVRVSFSSSVEEIREEARAPQQPLGDERAGREGGEPGTGGATSSASGEAAAAAVSNPGVPTELQDGIGAENIHRGRGSPDAGSAMSPYSASTSSASPVIAASPFSSTASASSSASPSSPPERGTPDDVSGGRKPPEVSSEIAPADELAALQLPGSSHYPERVKVEPHPPQEAPKAKLSSAGSNPSSPPVSRSQLLPHAVSNVTTAASKLLSFILSLLAAVALLPVRAFSRRKAPGKSLSSRRLSPSGQPGALTCSAEVLDRQLSVVEEKVRSSQLGALTRCGVIIGSCRVAVPFGFSDLVTQRQLLCGSVMDLVCVPRPDTRSVPGMMHSTCSLALRISRR